MSTPDTGTSKSGGVKTLAIRLDPDTHAQLSLIAQLRDSTITDEIRQAIDAHIQSVKASSDLAARADGVLEDIERDAAARREAIATLFGTDTATGSTPAAGDSPSTDTAPADSPGSRTRTRRSGGRPAES